MVCFFRRSFLWLVLGSLVMAPQWTQAAEATPPSWIPLSSVQDENGNVVLDKLPASVGRMIAAGRRSNQRRADRGMTKSAAANRCDVGLHSNREIIHPMGESFAEQVALAHAVVDGKITRLESGFDRIVPGVLMEISVEKLIRTDGAHEVHGPLTYFFPSARFQVDDTWVCANHEHGGVEPWVGQRVLLLLVNAPVHEAAAAADAVVRLEEAEILFQPAPGAPLSLPRRYLADRNLSPRLSLDEIVAWISSGQAERETSANR